MAATDDRAERDTQREGRWLLFGGVTVIAADVTAAFWFRADTGNSSPYELFLTVMAGGAVAIAAGLQERFIRPWRKAVQQALDNQALIVNRINHIDETFTRLAETLPQEVDKAWWRGAAHVSTENLADTGTTGRPRTPTSQTGDILKLVRPQPPRDN